MPNGPDFLSLQVRDLAAAAAFYEQRVGFTRAPFSPPHAVVFAGPIPFAVRELLPGTDLDASTPGLGVALWLRVDDAQALHDRLVTDGVPIGVEPYDSPFGRAFGVTDPDGYALIVHDQP